MLAFRIHTNTQFSMFANSIMCVSWCLLYPFGIITYPPFPNNAPHIPNVPCVKMEWSAKLNMAKSVPEFGKITYHIIIEQMLYCEYLLISLSINWMILTLLPIDDDCSSPGNFMSNILFCRTNIFFLAASMSFEIT